MSSPIKTPENDNNTDGSADCNYIDDLEGADLAQEVLDQHAKAKDTPDQTDPHLKSVASNSKGCPQDPEDVDIAKEVFDQYNTFLSEILQPNKSADAGNSSHRVTTAGIPIMMDNELVLPGAFAIVGSSTNQLRGSATNQQQGSTTDPDRMEAGQLPPRASNSTASSSSSSSSERMDDSGLVEAMPVTPIDISSLQRAEPSPEDQSQQITPHAQPKEKSRHQRLVSAVGCGFIAVLSLGIVIGVAVSNRLKNSQDSTGIETFVTYIDAATSPLNGVVPADAWDLIQVQGSPQAKAHQWLVADPNVDKYDEPQLTQRFALATFYYSTNANATSWSQDLNWLSYDHHECDWYFSDQSWNGNENSLEAAPLEEAGPCSESPQSQYSHSPYVRLWMSQNTLVGTLPEELYLLTELESIDMSLQHYTHKSLLEISTTSFFIEAVIENYGGPNNPSAVAAAAEGNTLHGTLSTRIGQLTNLKELKLMGGHFTGRLPSELGRLSNSMDGELQVYGNFFTGTIPEELFYLSSLRAISFSLTSLRGTIPTSIGLLSSINWLMITKTQLSGRIPSEIGLLIPFFMMLPFNQLTGPIPSEIGLMSNLAGLNLESNQLSGPIPTEVGQMTGLGTINVENNLLSGGIPSELGHLSSRMEMLYLGYNRLSSSIATELGLLSHLNTVRVHENDLTGTLPSQVGHWKMLVDLQLGHNSISGFLPSEIGLLGGNNTGEPDEDIGRLPNAYTIDFSNNLLSGTLPTELGNLELWRSIVVQRNYLEGPLPSELGSMTHLETFAASSNKLTGTIPQQLGDLPNLSGFHVEKNALSGQVPLGVCSVMSGPGPDAAIVDVPIGLSFDCNATRLCGCSCECSL